MTHAHGVDEAPESDDYLAKRTLRSGTAGWVLLAGLGSAMSSRATTPVGTTDSPRAAGAGSRSPVSSSPACISRWSRHGGDVLGAPGGRRRVHLRPACAGPLGRLCDGHRDPHRIRHRTRRDRHLHRRLRRGRSTSSGSATGGGSTSSSTPSSSASTTGAGRHSGDVHDHRDRPGGPGDLRGRGDRGKFSWGNLTDIAVTDAAGASSFLPYGYLGIWAAVPFAIWFFLAVEGCRSPRKRRRSRRTCREASSCRCRC